MQMIMLTRFVRNMVLKLDRECWLWRAFHYDGKLGAWKPCYGFKPEGQFGGNEYIQLTPKEELDIANTRIKALEEILQWYVDEDEIHEGDPENQYWIDGKHKAIKLLGSNE